jgi:hypothetical protein
MGNLPQWLAGTYLRVGRDQLQVYLDEDELVLRHNCLRFPVAVFHTLPGLGSGHKPAPCNRIRGAADISKKSVIA